MRTVHGWVSGTAVIRIGQMQCAQDPNAAQETVRHVFKCPDHLAMTTDVAPSTGWRVGNLDSTSLGGGR